MRKRRVVIGIDEAGRGPIAGPITVGAIVIGSFNLKNKVKSPKLLKNIKDSKKLTVKKREDWHDILKENFECKTASVGPKTIDRIGIQKATHLAVARVLRNFSKKPQMVLLDGLLKAPKHYKQETITRGDQIIPVISAASIIAKVRRDKKMIQFHRKHPKYCFDRHKGYGTKLHYKMLKTHGPCEIHRRSFRLK